MKRILSIIALATFTLTCCSTDPCGNLVGYEKDSCLQCQEPGGSDYFRTVRKPKDFPTVNLDSLGRYGIDSLGYRRGHYHYEVIYTLPICSDTEDVKGLVVINYSNSLNGPVGANIFLPYGSIYRYSSSHLFKYQIDKNGVIGPVTF